DGRSQSDNERPIDHRTVVRGAAAAGVLGVRDFCVVPGAAGVVGSAGDLFLSAVFEAGKANENMLGGAGGDSGSDAAADCAGAGGARVYGSRDAGCHRDAAECAGGARAGAESGVGAFDRRVGAGAAASVVADGGPIGIAAHGGGEGGDIPWTEVCRTAEESDQLCGGFGAADFRAVLHVPRWAGNFAGGPAFAAV